MLTAHIMSTTLGYAGAVTVPPPIPPRVVFTGGECNGMISAVTGDELVDNEPHPSAGFSVATNKRTKERGFVPNNFFEKQGEQFVHTDPFAIWSCNSSGNSHVACSVLVPNSPSSLTSDLKRTDAGTSSRNWRCGRN